MVIRISTRSVGWLLCSTIGLLAVLSVAGQVQQARSEHIGSTWYSALFDLDREQNISTWWQGTVILMCAAALGVIAIHQHRVRERFRWAWTGLAAIFVVVAMDEMCSLHEQLGKVLSSRGIALGGAFKYQWVVPAIGIILVLGIVYVPFLLSLSRRFQVRFALAGAIYLCGAVGFEMIGAAYASGFTEENLTWHVIATLEEVLEMGGMSLFLVSLIGYASEVVPRVTLQFAAGTSGDAAAAPSYTTTSVKPISRIAA
jgi:hypothetical protein